MLSTDNRALQNYLVNLRVSKVIRMGYYKVSEEALDLIGIFGPLDTTTKVARFNPERLDSVLDGISELTSKDFKYLEKYPLLRLGRFLKKYMGMEFFF